MLVSGGLTSTVQVRVSGVGSSLLAASTALTENVCWVSASPVYDAGEVQPVNGAASSEHWNVAPCSFDVNENWAAVAAVGPLGPAVIVVSGALLSIVQERTAGALVPVTPSGTSSPSATTANVCGPAGSGPATSTGDVHGDRTAPSSEHQYLEAPTAENANEADVSAVEGGGPAVTEGAGACVGATGPNGAASVACTLPGAGLAVL